MIAREWNVQNGCLSNWSIRAYQHGQQVKTCFIHENDRSPLKLGFFLLRPPFVFPGVDLLLIALRRPLDGLLHAVLDLFE